MDQFRFVKRIDIGVGNNSDFVINLPDGIYESGYDAVVKGLLHVDVQPTFISGRVYVYSTTDILTAGLEYEGMMAGKVTFTTGMGPNTEINFF